MTYFFFQISRAIDTVLSQIAPVLPLDESINILKPVIATEEFPSNLCALNTLIELIQCQGKDLTEDHLNSLMPNLAAVCFEIIRHIYIYYIHMMILFL